MNKKVLALAAASAVLAACGTGVLTVAVPDPPPFKLVDEASIQTPLVTTLDATGSIPEPIVSPPVPVEKQDSLANIPDFIKVQSVGKVELRAKFGLRKGGADSVRSLVFLPKEFENQAFELRNLTAKAVFFRTGDPEPTACTGPNAFDVVSNLTVTGTVSAGDVVNASKVLNEAERNTLKLLLNAYLDRSKSGGWSVKGCVVSGQVLLNNAPFSNGKLTVKEIELLVEQIRAGL